MAKNFHVWRACGEKEGKRTTDGRGRGLTEWDRSCRVNVSANETEPRCQRWRQRSSGEVLRRKATGERKAERQRLYFSKKKKKKKKERKKQLDNVNIVALQWNSISRENQFDAQ